MMELNPREKADILSSLLNEAYCCYRRYEITRKFVQGGNSDVASRFVSSNGEMQKYIKLCRKIAEDLNIEYIDWENPSKFPLYVF